MQRTVKACMYIANTPIHIEPCAYHYKLSPQLVGGKPRFLRNRHTNCHAYPVTI